MNMPARPHFQSQDPNHGGSCWHNDTQYGWFNCTPTSTAMAIERATLGKHKPSGCDIRIRTGDWSGGTMLSQCSAVAKRDYGVDSTVHVGSNFLHTDDLRARLEQGHGVVTQGNAGALLGTPFQSTRGYVNHAVYGNDILKAKDVVLVYDPARSNRISSFGKVEAGPQWWPWKQFVEFAAKLRPAGDNTMTILGYGKAYAAVYPDMEPHVHLRFAGSHPTSTLPRTFIVKSPVPGERVNVRKGPSAKYDVVKTKPNGSAFHAYQRNDNGQSMSGSRTWFGNHTGTRWIHESGLTT